MDTGYWHNTNGRKTEIDILDVVNTPQREMMQQEPNVWRGKIVKIIRINLY